MARKFKWQSLLDAQEKLEALVQPHVQFIARARFEDLVQSFLNSSAHHFRSRGVPESKIENFAAADRALWESREFPRILKAVEKEFGSDLKKARLEALSVKKRMNPPQRSINTDNSPPKKSTTITNKPDSNVARFRPSIKRICSFHGITIEEFYENPPQEQERLTLEASK